MPLGEQGFSIIELPEVSQEILDSYEDCPLDEYMGNLTRYKRFSQYRLSHVDGDGWKFDLLPHRDYTAFKKFNKVGGGFRRPYQPIQVDFQELIKVGAAGLELDTADDWQINVHQNRTRATVEKPGQLTPEGVHQDGHEFVMIAILRKKNVAGAVTRLWKSEADEPFWSGSLPAGQAVLLDDRAVWHDVTDVLPEDGKDGHRDIVIIAFSRWKEKWYGEEHDEAALSADQEPPTTM